MVEIKQYGLHRSGTNFLRVILQENYHVSMLTNIGGWKHGFYELPQRLGRELDCAICVKDPYAWVHSFYNYRHPEQDLPFEDFVRGPLTVVGPDGPGHTISSPNPLQHWVRMNEHWLGLELKEHRKFLFSYEKVLADPIGSIQELVRSLGLQRRKSWRYRAARLVRLAGPEPKFFLPKKRLGAVPEHYKNKHINRGQTFDPGRYTKHKYLDAFAPDLLAFANDQLKPELMTRLGYKMVDPGVLASRD